MLRPCGRGLRWGGKLAKTKIMGKGKKKNGKPFWKKQTFIIPLTVTVIGIIFEEIFVSVIRNCISPSQTAVVRTPENSPEFVKSLIHAGIEIGQLRQIVEERERKIKELEEALKERNVSKEALARFEAGDYAEAEALFAKELKEGAEKTANAAYYLGNIKFTELRFDEALNYYQKANELEPGNSQYLTGLGSVYLIKGKYEEGIKHFKQALSIDRKVYGERHSDVAKDLNNLAVALDLFGDSNEAIKYYEQSLDINRKVYGEKHLFVARNLINIANAWRGQGNQSYAKELSEQARSILQELNMEKSPYMAGCLNDIGASYFFLGNYPKALEFYERALGIYSEVYGEKHPRIANTLDNIGVVWGHIDCKKAVKFHKQALSMHCDFYGDKHPDVVRDLSNLGLAFYCLKDYKKAKKYGLMAYEISVEILGENHPLTLQAKSNLDWLPK